MAGCLVVDAHAHVGDPTVPSRIASKAATNPGVARMHTLQEAVGYMDGMVALSPSAENFVKLMDQCGITHAMIAQLGFSEELGGIELLPNQVVLDVGRKYPDRLSGIVGVDPRKGPEAVRELETYVNPRARGITGSQTQAETP